MKFKLKRKKKYMDHVKLKEILEKLHIMKIFTPFKRSEFSFSTKNSISVSMAWSLTIPRQASTSPMQSTLMACPNASGNYSYPRSIGSIKLTMPIFFLLDPPRAFSSSVRKREGWELSILDERGQTLTSYFWCKLSHNCCP